MLKNITLGASSGQRLVRLLSMVALAAACVTHAQAQPATEPLLTKAAPVRPNLLFVLDNSGSMSDTDAYARHYYVASGTCGTLALANLAPINNQLTYDPAKRYEPAYSNTGAPGTNASIPNTLDYTFYLPKTGQNITALTTKGAICSAGRYDTYRVRYVTSPSSSKFYLNGVDLGTTNPITPKGVKRTDCTGTSCTITQELQNIANFKAYHETRLKAARTGLGKAFATQPDTFRMAWGTIHMTDPNRPLTGGDVDDPTAMKDFGLAKPNFYTWLNTFAQESGTPLRKALDVAGQYYTRTDKNGPWAHSPWKTNSEGEATSDHMSCRKSFTILVTDGEWNGSSASSTVANTDWDNTTGSEIVANDGVTKYKYIPRGTDPRDKGKADLLAAGTGYKDTLADVAHYYWSRDLRGTGNVPLVNDVKGNAFWQNMITFTAGLGVQGTYSDVPTGSPPLSDYDKARAALPGFPWPNPALSIETKIDDLVHAAHNGGGEYLKVNDAESFTTEIGRVVGGIASDQFSQSGVAASAVTLTAGTRKFVPYFTSGTWWGNVKMINLKTGTSAADLLTFGDENGTAWEVIPTDVNNKPTGAADKIGPHGTRKVYTWVDGTTKAIDFKTLSILGANGLVAGSAGANKATLLNNAITQNQIDYLRGDTSLEGTSFRTREARLGDITNSTPVMVKNFIDMGYQNLPAGTPGLSSYSTYKVSKGLVTDGGQRNEGVLFVGANDGMLHGFREGSASTVGGTEIFAYVPRGVLGNLHLLSSTTYSHRYFVDGPLNEIDAFISAPSLTTGGNVTRWTNMVLGNLGAGGRGVFALDTTDLLGMSSKSVLWDITHEQTGFANMGYVANEVQGGITASGDWVGIFGNGKYGASGRAHLFIVNLSTGALIKEINTDSAVGNGLAGVRLVRNGNGQIIGAYAGDYRGRMWRFDLSASASSAWPSTAELLFSAVGPTGLEQPISAAPAVTVRTDRPGYMVVFGTGKLFDSGDQTNIDPQAAYGI
ncbi:MAG TPA: PilC/PilY family type IV pilus protein, partial [Rhodoferax sp.]|nr:PilC/PilY family type IV pilus protein [Rhodoferax sp.]